MERLIDADKTIGLLKTRLYETALNNATVNCDASQLYTECADNRIEAWIDEMPTADAVEVVRCKNCVCCDRDNGSLWCGLVGLHVDGDHFCAWGEKKDGWLVDRVYKIGEEQERKSVHLTEICADIWGNTK